MTKLDERAWRLLSLVQERPCTIDELMADLGCDHSTVRFTLRRARELGEPMGIAIPRPIASTGYVYTAQATWLSEEDPDEFAIWHGAMFRVADELTRIESTLRDASIALDDEDGRSKVARHLRGLVDVMRGLRAQMETAKHMVAESNPNYDGTA